MKYFVAVATDVSKTKTDSQLWYINGTWVNIVNPADVRTLTDGRIMLAWTIDENKGYALTGETVFGLTSTDSHGRSVISYVGFTSDLNALQREFNAVTTELSAPEARLVKGTTIYALDGTQRSRLAHGVNIVVDDGKAVIVYQK